MKTKTYQTEGIDYEISRLDTTARGRSAYIVIRDGSPLGSKHVAVCSFNTIKQARAAADRDAKRNPS